MSTIEDGGPAFAAGAYEHNGGGCLAWQDGMSLRDYFAAKAMQGFVSGHFAKYGYEDYWPRPEIASEAYEMADAMIAARKPEYDPARMASQALDDRATIAGLESAVSHLSALFDEFRALLVEVDDVCGRDGHGGPLEDGESEIIDKVRAALSMTEPAPRSKPES